MLGRLVHGYRMPGDFVGRVCIRCRAHGCAPVLAKLVGSRYLSTRTLFMTILAARAKSDDPWIWRTPVRRLLEAAIAVRDLARRGRGLPRSASLEGLSCASISRGLPCPYRANSNAAFSATMSMRSSCAVIIPE